MRGNFTKDRNGCKNPNYKHGLRKTRLFSIWANMKTRCQNPNTPVYEYYGARGITVCDEWKDDFQSFYDWSMMNGYSDNLTIDRIDNDGNYEPSNCRWVTMKEQSENTRRNHIVVLNEISKPLSVWCNIYNINYKTVRDRLKRGWSYQDALSKPVQTKFRKKVS